MKSVCLSSAVSCLAPLSITAAGRSSPGFIMRAAMAVSVATNSMAASPGLSAFLISCHDTTLMVSVR